MKLLKKFFIATSFLFFILLLTPLAFAQQSPAAPPIPQEEIMKANVIAILSEGEREVDGKQSPYQIVKVHILDGKEKGKDITIKHGDQTTLRPDETVQVGETVVVSKTASIGTTTYEIYDKYRLNSLIYITLAFFALILLLTRWKGLGSIIGLAVSLFVIVGFVVPQILAGSDPFWTIIGGAIVIMLITMYLAHGFRKTTHVAILGTILSLLCVGFLATFFVGFANISGIGNEDTYALQFNQATIINFQGLLLGGIIIGALGVLDDITSGIAVTIDELLKANPAFTFGELFKSGIRIGSEHIASLVNTLVLAYASVGLPLFMFMVINPEHQPLWVILNSEQLAEEIVRTLAGSMGLVLAVPITTIIAAWILTTTVPHVTGQTKDSVKEKRFLVKREKKIIS